MVVPSCPVNGFTRALLAGGFALVGLLAPSTVASATTADFSTHGQGSFDQSFYRADGVTFTEGTFVGYIQGDDALVGSIAGDFKPKGSSLSARVAPAAQGTATYTLTALAASDKPIASTSVTVTQDEGDPANSGWGYFDIDLGQLPKRARAFTLTNTFVRSSYPHITTIPFGVSSLSF
jgi:hypothetical protein